MYSTVRIEAALHVTCGYYDNELVQISTSQNLRINHLIFNLTVVDQHFLSTYFSHIKTNISFSLNELVN